MPMDADAIAFAKRALDIRATMPLYVTGPLTTAQAKALKDAESEFSALDAVIESVTWNEEKRTKASPPTGNP